MISSKNEVTQNVAEEIKPGQPLLDLVNVCRDFDKVKVIKNVNLVVKKNEFFTLVGPSGSGKTTILKMLAGMNGSAEASLVASTMALKKSMDIEQSMMAKLFGQTADINMQTPDKEASARITNPTQFIQNEALKLGKLDIYA